MLLLCMHTQVASPVMHGSVTCVLTPRVKQAAAIHWLADDASYGNCLRF